MSQNSYSQTINHYNVLRTIEEANRLTTHAGSAATAGIIDYCWAIPTALNNTVISKIQEGNTSERNIYIFPNPANDKINVVLKNMAPKKYIGWEIIDITGKKFKSGIVSNATKSNGVEIPVHNLKSGAYLLRISDGVNTKVNKFIKSR